LKNCQSYLKKESHPFIILTGQFLSRTYLVSSERAAGFFLRPVPGSVIKLSY